MTIRVNVWSSPRNLSTALMYSWRTRADTRVFDEPLYAHYLRASGREHPGRDQVLASQNQDGVAVVRDLMLGDYEEPIVFFKQMAKHLVDLDRSFLEHFENVLLTREPHDMLTSLQKNLPDASVDDTGFVEIDEILDSILSVGGEPIVIDSQALLMDPPAVLGALCERLGVPFTTDMLSWPAGPKPEDGVWAVHWYDAVHRSVGWQPFVAKTDELLPNLEPVLASIQPYYERLLPYCIGR